VKLALLLLVAACGKNKAVQLVGGTADAVCACPDRACADAALAKAAQRIHDELEGAKGTEEDVKAIEAAKQRIQGCQRKLTSAPASAPASGAR
jgi:hypothetical protein